MSQTFKFTIGETVLCHYGHLLYEAKCLKAEQAEDKSVFYYVHYVGWSKKWDAWIPEDKVLKYNRRNVQKQRELKLAHIAESKLKKTTKRRNTSDTNLEQLDSDSKDSVSEISVLKNDIPDLSMQFEEHGFKNEGEENDLLSNMPEKSAEEAEENSPSSPSSVIANELEKLQLDENVELPIPNRIEVKIMIPDTLKQCLIDDRDLVSGQKKLVKLPETPNILEIFNSYLVDKHRSCPSRHFRGDDSHEMVCGLENYFDVVLNTQLLYNIERPQYEDIRSKTDGVPLCSIYGGIHLLRLFVKLGSLISYSFEPPFIHTLVGHFEDLLQYLARNKSKFFGTEHYENATQEYLQRVE